MQASGIDNPWPHCSKWLLLGECTNGNRWFVQQRGARECMSILMTMLYCMSSNLQYRPRNVTKWRWRCSRPKYTSYRKTDQSTETGPRFWTTRHVPCEKVGQSFDNRLWCSERNTLLSPSVAYSIRLSNLTIRLSARRSSGSNCDGVWRMTIDDYVGEWFWSEEWSDQIAVDDMGDLICWPISVAWGLRGNSIFEDI